jgi:hypothetical protein
VLEGETIPPTLKAERNKWGAYVVSNYWPWSYNEPPSIPPCERWLQGKVLTVDWNGFCDLCDYLYDPQASFIARGRLFEIESLAYGTREHPEHGAEHKKLITMYRYSNADNLRSQINLNPFGLSQDRINRDMAARGQEASGQFDEVNDAEARIMMQEIHDRNHVDEQCETRALNKDIKRQEYNQKLNVKLNALFDDAKQSAENNLIEQNRLHLDVRALESIEAKGEYQPSFFNNQSIALKTGPIEYEGGLSPAERARQAMHELQTNSMNEFSVTNNTEEKKDIDVGFSRGMIDSTTTEMSAENIIQRESEELNNAGENNVIKKCNNI